MTTPASEALKPETPMQITMYDVPARLNNNEAIGYLDGYNTAIKVMFSRIKELETLADELAWALKGMIYLKEGGDVQQETGIYKSAKQALEKHKKARGETEEAQGG